MNMNSELKGLMDAIKQITKDELVVSDTRLYKEFCLGDSVESLNEIKTAAYNLEYEGILTVIYTNEGGFILKLKDNTEH